MRFRSIYLCLLVTASILMSCSDDDSFTTSRDARLTFPLDTLRLDTAISGIPTSTYSFVVRNKGSKGIRISKARLLKGDEFQANVDGTNINAAYDYPIEVRKGDSITVFVKLLSKKTSSDEAQPVEDVLQFVLESGEVQSVTLLGYSQDVYTLGNYTISSDTTFTPERPIHITGTLKVAEGKKLTILPGTTLIFSPVSSLDVEGQLYANGTTDSAIVFRCDRMDHMFTHQTYDKIPGMWRGVNFRSSSYGNYLNHVEIHGGEYGLRADSSDVSREKLRVENSRITNTKGDCVTLTNCLAFIGNSELSNTLGNCVTIYGGDYSFVHCTIANFYPFEGDRGRAVWLYNSYNGRSLPLRSALFENCIISGWSEDELFASFSDDNTEKSYLFRSCLLTTPEPEDKSEYPGCIFENTQDTLWGSKNFRKFDYDYLIFDFRLKAQSLARNNADVAVTQNYYPLDRNGVARLDDNAADIGCYEYVEEGK